MKKILIILIYLSLNQFVYGQIKPGYYANKYDYIELSDDSVCFDFTIYSCLVTRISGCGVYHVTGNFLVIETKEYKGEKSIVEKIFNKSDSTKITVLDKTGVPIMGASLLLIDSSGKTFGGTVTNHDGKATIKGQSELNFIQVNYIAYDRVSFKFEPDHNYIIKLVEGNVIEYQTVVFEIVSNDSGRLELALLDQNFNERKETEKSLKRLKKHTRKHDYHVSIFEKKQSETENSNH
jgi:hypothetical protein